MIAIGIDILISEGHNFSDIRGYSWPQFNLFLDLISLRYESRNQEDKNSKNPNVTVKSGLEYIPPNKR